MWATSPKIFWHFAKKASQALFLLQFTEESSRGQRGKATGPRSHSRVLVELGLDPGLSGPHQSILHHRRGLVIHITMCLRAPREVTSLCLQHRKHLIRGGHCDLQCPTAQGLRAAAKMRAEELGGRGTWEKVATEGLPFSVNSAFPSEGFEFWSLDVNGGDEWKVEDLSRDQRKEFPNDQVKKYFVTSY